MIKNLNEKIAVRLSDFFMSMGFFWFLLISLPIAYQLWPLQTGFISSSWLQAWMLPLLGVSEIVQQNREKKYRDELEIRRQKDHEELKCIIRYLLSKDNK